MITNTGKDILSKYLIGQAPAYASYIAVGCGAKPLDSESPGEIDYSSKTSLDFEMFRVPIISRGYVNEGGVSKIVFTAELPTEERYEISELGVYSAGSNKIIGANNSRSLYVFSQTENWEYHLATGNSSAIPSFYEPLDLLASNQGDIEIADKVFQTNADNEIFRKDERIARYENCRFLNNIIAIRGDDATITTKLDGSLDIEEGSNHIHLAGVSINLNSNSPTDELRLAFSVINKTAVSLEVPDRVKIMLEFASSDQYDSGDYARFEVDLENGTGGIGSGEFDFETNRYVVVSKQLQQLVKSPAFTWNTVDVIKVYSSVIVDGEPSDDYYIGIDALRLENTNQNNPLYGLTGYSSIISEDAKTIIKGSNTTSFVEFRFAIDIDGGDA